MLVENEDMEALRRGRSKLKANMAYHDQLTEKPQEVTNLTEEEQQVVENKLLDARICRWMQG